MKKICRQCGGTGRVKGPYLADIDCQICDGEGTLPISFLRLDKDILYLEDKRKPTHK